LPAVIQSTQAFALSGAHQIAFDFSKESSPSTGSRKV
jgi:hypothetical protein